MQNWPTMQPTGWFQVAWGADLAIGQVKALRYFDRDLVAFRALDGQAWVMDAHCRHLGANLAYGGCVVEDGIRCPFHGWVWNGQGRNVSIPYQDRPNRGRRIRSYPVTEANGSIFIWHDPAGRDPLWHLPNDFEMLGDHVASRSYHPFDADCRTRFPNIHVHPQIVAENAVDPHHFRFVHHTPISPVVLRENVDMSTWSSKVGFGKRWADGVDRPDDTLNTIEIYWSGLGVSFNAEHTREGIRVISICTTPVDDQTSDIFAGYWIDDETGDFAGRLAQAKYALPQDIQIWNHQQYMDPPTLATSEAAGFKKLRAWCSSFYPHHQAAADRLVGHRV
ncbi:Rieske 2Fe-2S domain-containing protein [Mycobacterium arosiense]|uniref:cholesterol 7-desaturase n=1 Tax=Mycobacterium arosiense ATCC BAA-1401 = DSM 45069 TaxID=1265311 RepID=A0A1W9ZR12_MYCAI|nr:Rieske 2Fe-2S domain-containing protein [Mycobacterium arosiense]ORA19966.1 Rieske (2Fe-2S) protein [Mycobacterium arosiense ATCC BAA-1401 = DSM 45069]